MVQNQLGTLNPDVNLFNHTISAANNTGITNDSRYIHEVHPEAEETFHVPHKTVINGDL
jgi:hypothetical protein